MTEEEEKVALVDMIAMDFAIHPKSTAEQMKLEYHVIVPLGEGRTLVDLLQKHDAEYRQLKKRQFAEITELFSRIYPADG